MSRRGRVSDFRRPIWTSVRRRWVDSRTWRCLSPRTQAVVELNRPKLTLDVAAIGQGPTMTTGSFRALSRRRQSDSARRQILVRHSGLAGVEPLLTQTETVVLTGGHRGRPRPEDRTAPHAQWTVTAGQGEFDSSGSRTSRFWRRAGQAAPRWVAPCKASTRASTRTGLTT